MKDAGTTTHPRSWLPFRLVWIAVGLHLGGIVIDSIFHVSASRPFGVVEMLWAHGLSYIGAGVAIIGGRGVARAGDRSERCRRAGTTIAVLGLIQALSLLIDFVTEVTEVTEEWTSAVYVFSLGVMIVTAIRGTAACRSAPRIG